MTVLVRSRHSPQDYQDIAGAMLSAGHVHAEQVGFIGAAASSAAHARLHMAGDEFCGNACMSLAALTIAERGSLNEDLAEVVLEVSGADGFVTCWVKVNEADFSCRLAVPLPTQVEPSLIRHVKTGCSALVRYHDSVHFVVESDPYDEDTRAWAEAIAVQLAETEDARLTSVLLYNPDHHEMAPLVSVPSLNSVVWENSCGSGLGALGAYLATTTGRSIRANVRQPGGVMRVEGDYRDGDLTGLRIGGRVSIVAEGRAYIYV